MQSKALQPEGGKKGVRKALYPLCKALHKGYGVAKHSLVQSKALQGQDVTKKR